MTTWTKHDLIELDELSKEEIELILETAKSFKEVSTREVKKVPALRGKTIVLMFSEPSTRTRISFELAAKRLSADTISISSSGSSMSKGESVLYPSGLARMIFPLGKFSMVLKSWEDSRRA